MNRRSRRFSPNSLMEKLMPVLLIVLLLGLAVSLAVVTLSVLGLTPGF